MSEAKTVSQYIPMAQWIDVTSEVARMSVRAFVSGAYPGIIMELDKDMAEIGPEAMEKLRAEFASKYQGIRDAGLPVTLPVGEHGYMRIIPVQPVATMTYVNTTAPSCRPSIVGLVEQRTYAPGILAHWKHERLER